MLKHVEGEKAGQPFLLERWQQAVVGNLFGWMRPNGTRRYREVFLYIPRGNGKTPIAAGIALYLLHCDGERGAQIYLVAAEANQAAIAYRHAVGMTQQEPELAQRSKIYKGFGHRSIVLKADDMASIRVVSSDASGKHGYAPHAVIADELHAWETRELLDVLESAFAKKGRRQPLMMSVTTADFARESACNEKLAHAQRVRDGSAPDSAFLPVIYETPSDADWHDEAVWQAANPNLGVTVDLASLRREHQKAIDTPSYEPTFRRLLLNQQTLTAEPWIGEYWDRCGGKIDVAALAGQACWGGLDLSSIRDVTALCLAFPPANGVDPVPVTTESDAGTVIVRGGDDGPTVETRGEAEAYRLLWWYWVPETIAQKTERRNRALYETWGRQGFIELTPGDVIDYGYIRNRLRELSKLYDLRELAVDPWNSEQFTQTLQADDGIHVVLMRQGYSTLSEPSKYFEQLVIRGGLRHGDNPVSRWMARNVALETDSAGNIKPSKKKSTEKIDGVIASVMAISRARGQAGGGVIDRGVLEL